MSKTAVGQRTKELEKFRLDTQRFIQDAQAELMGVRRDAESAFLVNLRPAIERVVKDNGIELLFNFESGVLVWGDPSLDVTTQSLKHVESPGGRWLHAFRAHAPTNGGEMSTAPADTTAERMRSSSVSISISAAVARSAFSIAGISVRTTSAIVR